MLCLMTIWVRPFLGTLKLQTLAVTFKNPYFKARMGQIPRLARFVV
jgi:hypothetical protein